MSEHIRGPAGNPTSSIWTGNTSANPTNSSVDLLSGPEATPASWQLFFLNHGQSRKIPEGFDVPLAFQRSVTSIAKSHYIQ